MYLYRARAHTGVTYMDVIMAGHVLVNTEGDFSQANIHQTNEKRKIHKYNDNKSQTFCL